MSIDKNELKLWLADIKLCLKTGTNRKNSMLLYFKKEINDEEKYKKFEGKLCVFFNELKERIKEEKNPESPLFKHIQEVKNTTTAQSFFTEAA